MAMVTGLPYREQVVRQAGQYRTLTGQPALLEAYDEVEAYMRPFWDVPPELQAADPTIVAYAQGKALPSQMSREDQARICIPLCNYFRLICERQPFEQAPPQVLIEADFIADALLQMDWDIAWVGIRNSHGWESSNRASTGGKPFDWMDIHKYIVRTRMMDLHRKIARLMADPR